MSRIGKQPIDIPAGVTVQMDGRTITVKGVKGELSLEVSPLVTLEMTEKTITVSRINDSKPAHSMHGTVRSLISNMIQGVKDGYKKELEINGVGFRAQMEGSKIVMSLGYSHPVVYEIPEGINVEVPGGTNVVIQGCDKQMVGQVSARLRAFAPAEPYKGKGVKYKGEQIRRKAGKTVA